MDRSRASRAVSSLAVRLGLKERRFYHEDLRGTGGANGRLRAELLTSGQVLVGDLDVSVPDRTAHRRAPATPLGRVNPAVRLPSTRTLDALKRRHGVRRMRAFRSAVRNDFRPDSDVDIVVRLAPDADQSLEALESLERDLERRLGRDVDLVLEENLHPAFQSVIRDEALPI